ncbi:hypothetical protein DEU56DRAFT_40618 [Suillus clintonianus]|uniref:uncharacterized protein n=1 Tax=Suillus clintonianus TaxID=1904413 RepID=UPI001B886D58|nr:uncharacterized protein DEU56DRAFT_40618 [Suillus clintonianus]KAG2124040.1 hypothetical protein DEU56DRAFT_40618 [Suillus clintonianus]
MEYSADNVAVARILQYISYIYMALATLWTYDYVCSLHEESNFLLRSRWTKVKTLYIITRYVPFCLITTNLLLTLAPNENPDPCCSLFLPSSYHSSAFGFPLLPLLIVFTTSAIPGITGCYRTANSILLTMPFILLFVFQLGLVSLTLIRAIQSWKSSRGPLYVILVRHNIFYYVCGLLLSAVNVLVPMLFSDSAYHSFLEDLEVYILAILATRMHLHLWHIGRSMLDSDTLVWISLSDISPAHRTT